jgi:hypothetical protein
MMQGRRFTLPQEEHLILDFQVNTTQEMNSKTGRMMMIWKTTAAANNNNNNNNNNDIRWT